MLPETALSNAEALDALRAAIATAGTAKAWAQKHRLSPQYISEILSGRREPSSRVLAPLGLQRVVLIVPAIKESRT